jgi:peptidoglycan hydrolase CwlO-like protein
MKSGLKRRLQTGTALICSLAMAFSVLPVSAEESTQSLESKTSDLAGQLAGINQELVAISDQISTTEMQVEITNGEIQRTKDSLADAQAKEAQQYNDMKTRIKYMYETGSASLLEMLFSAEDMTDFLNKADFIQNISDYDRKMLTELQETKNQIAEEEKTLQAQQDSLVSLQTSLDKKQSDLEAKAAATSTDLATFQAQLAALRAQEAAELEAKRQQELQQQQQQKSDKPSSGDGNSTVTPTPPTTPDSGGDIIQGGGSDATHDELTTFAALLDCEAIHDYNSMLAVATVIMNRVESPLFPNSIHGVIYATGQFEPVWSGRLDSVLNSGPSSLALQVTQDAVNGARLSSVIDCYYFLYAGATDRPESMSAGIFSSRAGRNLYVHKKKAENRFVNTDLQPLFYW